MPCSPRSALRAAAAGLATLALAAAAAAPAFAATASPRGAGCDRLDDAACMLPFPSDAYVIPSASQTRKRLVFRPRNMPRNARGAPISTAAYRTFDGFSPSSTIITKVPGLDTPAALARTKPAGLTTLSRYRARTAPVVVFDAADGKRFPIWAELDPSARRAGDRLLLIHPAKSLQEGHRYVVALRDLQDARGRRIAARPYFAALRDGRRRDPRFQSIFRALRRAGIKRDGSLFAAWDFTVASGRSLTGRLQTIRDRAFTELGDSDLADARIDGAVPPHTVAAGTVAAPAGTRVVEGTVTVPCFLDTTGCAPGGAFHYDRAGDFLPAQRPGNVARAHFTCIVPLAATPDAPARLVLYGHDVLGSDGDVVTAPGPAALATSQNLALCAVPLTGMSSADAATVTQAVADASRMPQVADGLQQGILDALYLGRLMAHPQGLAADPLLQEGGRPVVVPGAIAYAGDGLGATAGAALTAVAPDLERGALGDAALHLALPEPTGYAPRERPLVRELVRLLTDRATAGGFAGHVTVNPPPSSRKHVALVQAAFGDAAGAPSEAEALARTIGARVHQPALTAARGTRAGSLWGMQALPASPWPASALVLWDAGASDPPGIERRLTPAAQQQIAQFLAPGGHVVDTCAHAPCRAARPGG